MTIPTSTIVTIRANPARNRIDDSGIELSGLCGMEQVSCEEKGPTCIGPSDLFLLLALAMGLLAVLSGILRVLLGIGGVFFALSVIAFAMMLGRRAMGFCSVLVMLSCLVVLVSGHLLSPALV